ncbi:MAG: M48 family metallopeptidase [Gammaproteobacteria bacterium]|nr:M48 family metallopeptidase [Gammaproteobacteria bacterium]
MEITGEFFDTLSSRGRKASLQLEGDRLSVFVDGDPVFEDLRLESLQDNRVFHFKCGRQFIADHAIDREFRRRHLKKAERFILWLERFSIRRALLLAVLVVSALALYRVMLSTASGVIVAGLPHSLERETGENAYLALKSTVFTETELPDSVRSRLTGSASALSAQMALPDPPEIHFHSSRFFGPNALAFPGGPIVVTDELVNLLDDDGEVLAVIAHELAHVRERHSLRQIVDTVGMTAIAAILFGADESLVEEATAILINARILRNSRGHEKEADLIALETIRNLGMDEMSLHSAISKLIGHSCNGDPVGADLAECLEGDVFPDWLSTHPSGAERLDYLSGKSGKD